MFIDGTAVVTASQSPINMNASTAKLVLGAIGNTNNFGSFDFNGRMDEIRISKGIARYTADFTPPSAAFPR
jgi:hypothetical protein